MLIYEVILDGELATDLTESPVPLKRRDVGGATVLSFPVVPDDTLSLVLSLLESLGIGVTAVHQVEDVKADRDHSGRDQEH
jgi:hypothetical protein